MVIIIMVVMRVKVRFIFTIIFLIKFNVSISTEIFYFCQIKNENFAKNLDDN